MHIPTNTSGTGARDYRYRRDQGAGDGITYSHFSNDPVSTSSLSGGNPGAWRLSDFWQMVTTSNSMHSCYGTGAPGCTQVQNPVPGGPQGTPDGNAKLIEYRGGELSASPSNKGKQP